MSSTTSAAADQPAGAAPASADSRTPLCFVVDGESPIRRFVSLILQGSGIDTLEFADGAAVRQAALKPPPDIVFLDVNLDAADATQTIEALGANNYPGAVQLMSNRGSAVLESVKAVGEQHKLKMLPVLKKPFDTSSIQKIVLDQKLGHSPSGAARIGLDEALKHNWIEFWFQPKIDLRKKQLAGAEGFPRARHPQHGILAPESFMPGAEEGSLLALAELALVSALKTGTTLSKLGVNLPIALNVPVAALTKLPVGDIVRAHRPDVTDWSGLVIDLIEEEIIGEIALATELRDKFAEHNVRLAIDDFGRGHASLMKFKELPFAEFKLDRSFVLNCGTDRVNAPICRTVIDLAHSVGSVAVGTGLEKAADVLALTSMGCNLGQGFLLGQAMPQERFIALLRQRATVRKPSAAPTPDAATLKSA